LGRAIGLALSRAGAKVAFTYSTHDLDAEEAAALMADAGESPPLVFKGSVDDAAHVKTTIKAVREAWGGLDVLVNNAGLTQVLPIALLEEEDWDRVMSVNVKGAYLFSRAALKAMIKARSGHILNIGNFASERIIEAPVHYAAAKSALRGFTEALAREVGRYGVAVNLVAPGLLDQGLSQMLPQHRLVEYTEQCPAGRLAKVEEVAEMITFLVSSENSFMTGAKIAIDGGL